MVIVFQETLCALFPTAFTTVGLAYWSQALREALRKNVSTKFILH